MRSLALAFALAVVLLAGTSREAHAQLAFAPNVGYIFEDGYGLTVGVGARLPLGALPLTLAPNVEYQFIDLEGADIDVSSLQLDVNALYRFAAGSIVPFAGAGLAVGFYSVEDESNTELGFNALGGAEFPGAFGFGDPYAQLRFTSIDGESALGAQVGLIIGLN